MRRDPVLAPIIKQVGPCRLADVPHLPPFMALAEAIASQQLSVKAADTIFGRFCGLFGPDNIPDPARLLRLEDAAIRGAGFSRSKIVFLRDLATHVVEKRLELDGLHDHEDDHVIEQLTGVKGIGTWTAQMFLIFRLKRPDVFPLDDLGIVKGVQRVYGLRQPPSRARMLKIADAWRPYRTVASWYLWRSLSLNGQAANDKQSKGRRARPPRKRVTIE